MSALIEYWKPLIIQGLFFCLDLVWMVLELGRGYFSMAVEC